MGATVVGALCAGIGFALAAGAVASGASGAGSLLAWAPIAVAQLSLGLVIALEGALAWMLLERRAARMEHETAQAMARLRGIPFRSV
jgi:hypothetical protein